MRTPLLLSALLALVAIPGARGAAEDAAGLMQEAARFAREKKYDQALETIHKALKLEPGNDRYLAVASEIELRAGCFTDGIEHARAALRINDRVGLYYNLVAANAYGNQDADLALEYCRKVLEKKPSEVGEAAYRDARAYEDMLLPRTYTITWNLDPRDPRKRAYTGDALIVALPKGGLPYQKVSVQVQGARSARVIPGEVNDVLRVVPVDDKPFQVVTKVT